mmetsp:Transcript_103468/g.183514  ORF Transcript_103468/g.183514 Transcript_103468/m.183514 type:complete len:103 (-) Transcript_103468:43-351(-)
MERVDQRLFQALHPRRTRLLHLVSSAASPSDAMKRFCGHHHSAIWTNNGMTRKCATKDLRVFFSSNFTSGFHTNNLDKYAERMNQERHTLCGVQEADLPQFG